jgi:hypothetical protein
VMTELQSTSGATPLHTSPTVRRGGSAMRAWSHSSGRSSTPDASQIALSHAQLRLMATRRQMSGDVTNGSSMCEGGASDPEEIQVVLRRRAPVVIGAVAALCLSAVACTPSEPTTPSPTPTASASPTETQLQRQTRLDFEAAEKAYRTFSAEYDRLAAAGGAPEPSRVLKETSAGPYLSDAATVLRKQHEIKARSTGRLAIAYVHSAGYTPTKLTLDACEDGTAIRIYDKKGKLLGAGESGTLTVEARRIDDRWKIWTSTNRQSVKSC